MCLLLAGWARASEPTVNSIGIKLIPVASGSFEMGVDSVPLPSEMTKGLSGVSYDRPDGNGDYDETPVHKVTITQPLLMSQTEVTVEQFKQFKPEYQPSEYWAPFAAGVSWNDAVAFCEWLSKKVGARYRLPSEAEWEYACRARTTGPFSTGENLTTAQANYNGRQPYGSFPAGEFRQKPTPAASFALNPWGLADMHGNVWEWTSDWYGPYAERGAANIDPHGPSSGDKRVIRGGSWYFDANSARCALRYTHAPQDKGFSLGFRVAADRLR